MPPLITTETPINDAMLQAIAHTPTKSLATVVEDDVWQMLSDEDFMRIATFLAQKSYDEGGCPIGGVIIDKETRRIVGKGHNTLVQEDDPYNHGETSAMRDAGRIDFSLTTMFTTLTPCNVCTALILERHFNSLVIGDITNTGPGNIEQLEERGVEVDVLEDPMVVDLYKKFQKEKSNLEMEDWQGVAGREGNTLPAPDPCDSCG